MLFFLYFTLSVNYHAVQPVVCVISYSLRAITHTTCVHQENSDILIRVQNVLKNITKFWKIKMFSLCLIQDELALFTWYISTTKLLFQLLKSIYINSIKVFLLTILIYY